MEPDTVEVRRFLDAWMRVRQIVQAANFNHFQRAGLSATQFMTLNVLPSQGAGMTLTELARRLNLSSATLNKTVNSLQERGLVQRRHQANDARKLDILVTPEGEALQNAASGEFHTFMSGLFAGMSGAARAGLLQGLEELVQLGSSAAGQQKKPRERATGRVIRRARGALPVKRSSP